MAELSIKKLDESFVEISAPEDVTYNIYSRYSEYIPGYQFLPKFKLHLFDRTPPFFQHAFRNPSNWTNERSSIMV